jgi:hypothetical protein
MPRRTLYDHRNKHAHIEGSSQLTEKISLEETTATQSLAETSPIVYSNFDNGNLLARTIIL